MNTSPDAGFDLEKLLLPAWAKESPQANPYAKYEGGPERREDRRGGDRRDRPFRRPDQGPGRGPRPGGPGQGQGQARGPGDRSRGARPGPGNRAGERDRGRGPDRGRDQGGRSLPSAEPLPEIQVAFTSDDYGVDMLAKQIRITGRAFPLFDIAQLILAKPERHCVTLSVKKKPDGTPVQPLFLCALDDTLWLSEDDAVRHVLEKHFNTFYQPERIKVDPPKGVYTFVAQCGMSGVILGPPNYHDYQNQLRKLHTERFARMPFEAFKSRVKIVKDEEVVKKWVEEQSWRTEFVCLNLVEATKLGSREEVEKHFRQVHMADIIKPADTHRLHGQASRDLRDRNLQRLIRQRWEEQKRFPLQLATVLSQQFASRGLQFFKVNKTVTHVAVARPHHLDLESSPVSDGVRRIVDYINATPKCTPRRLLDALAPRPPAPPIPVPPPPAPTPTPDTASPAPAGSGEGTAEAPAASASPAPAPAPPAVPETTPEMAAILTDLHWLIHQGHVIEFANGVLETAKKPVARPPRPEVPRSSRAAAGGAVPEAELPDVEVPETELPETAVPHAEAAAPAETPPVETPTTENPPSASPAAAGGSESVPAPERTAP